MNDPGDDDAVELNLDGIVGLTHSYAGLSYGNLASQRNRQAVSNPKEAALQGLAKMKLLADLGVPQAVLPPQERPDVEAFRSGSAPSISGGMAATRGSTRRSLRPDRTR